MQQVPDPRGRLSGRLSKPDTDILGDAAYCQQDMCETITQNNGDYSLIVKDNQPKLHRAAQQSFVILKDFSLPKNVGRVSERSSAFTLGEESWSSRTSHTECQHAGCRVGRLARPGTVYQARTVCHRSW
ncbi:MAG: hypothetical protein R3C02_04820 [Planctomycetaceae bacterium]